MNNFVSVVIPVYNGADTLRECMTSIFKSDYKNFEVILVDDASIDNSVSIGKEFNCTVIELKENKGAANARNIGTKQAKGDIIFFTDSDCLVQKNTITNIVEIFGKRSDLTALIGSYTLRTPVKNFITTFHNLRHHYTHQTSREEAMTFWTGCGAIRKDVFEKLGGFDIEFKAATIEDIELGYRLSRAGYKIQLNKDVFVTHLKKYNFVKLIKTDVMHRALPWTKLMLETGTYRSDLNTTRVNAIAMSAVYLMFLFLLIGLFINVKFFIPVPVLFLIFASTHTVFYSWVYLNFGIRICLGVIAISPLFFFYSGAGLIGGILAYYKDKYLHKKTK
jgi:GT2 family glycosyltransferase